MRNRLLTVAATLGLLVAGARAQEPAAPSRGLPPSNTDPFSAPFFKPLGTPDVTLADAVAVNDPRGVAIPSEVLDACDPGFRTWTTAELLIGRTRGPSVAPVVTTGPVQSGALAGAIGQPTTLPLFGGKRILDDWRSGLRVEVGAWLDDERTLGIGARFYSLFSTSEQFRAIPNGATVINVPQIVNVGAVPVQIPAFVGFPGVTTGHVATSAQTTFMGGDLNWRLTLGRTERMGVELLAGYRQLYLTDELNANFTVSPLGTNVLVTPLTGGDSVRTRNNFYGPQLGLSASTGGDRFWVEGHAASALGVTASTLDFSRSRTGGTGANPAAVLAAIGLPATPANLAIATAAGQIPLGQTNVASRLSYFGVVGEGGVRLNWRATEHVRVTAGYGFLYWNNVRRAQEMFVLAPVLRPQAIDFTTHLFSVGLDLRF